ncbi:MAG TPA: CHASE domain-containing protein, partial [Clostridia bacterium]|nr:CHASE domain-containing protein [Clostridia bacterium]
MNGKPLTKPGQAPEIAGLGREALVPMEQISPANQPAVRPGASHRAWIPPVILLAGLALTFLSTYYATRALRTQQQARFESAVEEWQGTLHARTQAYITLLRGGSAFVAGNPYLNREQFHAYVKRLHLQELYPGIQGLGYSVRLLPAEKDVFVRRMRAQGAPDFHIWPEFERMEYHTIAYLEPLDARNQAALGYDMFTEPVRRAAMEMARDSGTAKASGKVRLVQEIEGKAQAGFLIFAPTYAGGDVPATVEERRANLTGFIYGPFRADDLFYGIYARTQGYELQREIFDGPTTNPEHLLHHSDDLKDARPPRFYQTRPSVMREIQVAGRTWTVRLTGGPEFYLNPSGPLRVLGGGILFSFLLFYLTRAQAKARLQAEQAAQQLRESERSLLEARGQLQAYTADLEKRVAERTSRLRESLQALEGVLYHVAHDLRAPLRAMASFTQILSDDYAGKLDRQGLDYLQRIFKASRRMDLLVKDLLAYGRLAHMPMPTCDVNPEEPLAGALNR